jgi:hypothetical protein
MAELAASEQFWHQDYTWFPLYNTVYEPECELQLHESWDCQNFNYFWATCEEEEGATPCEEQVCQITFTAYDCSGVDGLAEQYVNCVTEGRNRDPENSYMYNQCELDGTWEMIREDQIFNEEPLYSVKGYYD